MGTGGRGRILAIDDDGLIGQFIVTVLGGECDVTITQSGEAGLHAAFEDGPFDLVLLDVDMAGMNGHDVCRLMRRDPRTASIPIIFLTARVSAEEEELGLGLGAVDYIAKPISPPILAARVKTHLELKSARDRLAGQNRLLEEKVRTRTRELELTQEVAILTLATLAETRDNETGMHIQRTRNYVRILAERLSEAGPYADKIDEDLITYFEKSAPLHDIGKVGVPDAILKKPGKLTEEERKTVQQHPLYGRAALESAEEILGTNSFLRHAKDIAACHHERWDGTGYPEGLKRHAIPLSARIMAVADDYDALISKRVYKQGHSHEDAVAGIVAGRGSHFDPAVVDAFLDCAEAFRKVAERMADE